MKLQDWLYACWYQGRKSGVLLVPLSWLYGAVSGARRQLYRSGILRRCRPPVPVIVVGNITVGGTGKTPLVIWLAEQAQALGFRPAIATRGYRGTAVGVVAVDPDSEARVVGDEAVLLARRSGLPVAAGADRCAVVGHLVRGGADLVICDDGLQHYRLRRDLEVAVIDAQRKLGNRRLLPAGPLREPESRLGEVDIVICNGGKDPMCAASMQVAGTTARNLFDGAMRALRDFDTPVHAVAGIGNPERFFQTLRRCGLEVREHPLPDHVSLQPGHLEFADQLPVLMTEKDAVKAPATLSSRYWEVPVSAQPDAAATRSLLAALQELHDGVGG